MTGASDFIACFLAGCLINWDGWYQEESAGQAFNEIVDMYLATVSVGKLDSSNSLTFSSSSCTLARYCLSITGMRIRISWMDGGWSYWVCLRWS